MAAFIVKVWRHNLRLWEGRIVGWMQLVGRGGADDALKRVKETRQEGLSCWIGGDAGKESLLHRLVFKGGDPELVVRGVVVQRITLWNQVPLNIEGGDVLDVVAVPHCCHHLAQRSAHCWASQSSASEEEPDPQPRRPPPRRPTSQGWVGCWGRGG